MNWVKSNEEGEEGGRVPGGGSLGPGGCGDWSLSSTNHLSR